jgi:hypothetical protein
MRRPTPTLRLRLPLKSAGALYARSTGPTDGAVLRRERDHKVVNNLRYRETV